MTLKPKERFEVLQRDGFTCRYCGQRPPAVRLHVDHIVPRSKGGSDDPDNLLTACSLCNAGKAARLIPGIEDEEVEDPIRMLSLGLLYLLHSVGPLNRDRDFFCRRDEVGDKRDRIAGAHMHYAWGIINDFAELPHDEHTRQQMSELTSVLGEWGR